MMPKSSLNRTSSIKKPILLINFDGGVFKHIQEFVVLEENSHGRRINRVGCVGGLKTCIPKQNRQLLESDEKICRNCVQNQLNIDVPNQSLIFNIENSKKTVLRKEIESALKDYKLNSPEVRDYRFKGVPIFRLIGFDLIMNTRNLDMDRKLEEFPPSVKIDVYNRIDDVCRIVDWTVENIELEKYGSVLACNGNYMINGIYRELALNKNVEFSSIEIEPMGNFGYFKYKYVPERVSLNSPHRSYQNYLGYSFSKVRFSRTLKNFENRMQGRAHNSYTELSEGHQESLKLKEFVNHFKEIRSIFLSSSEELLAHQYAYEPSKNYQEFLETQVNFVIHLFEEAKNFPNIGLIIRIHPRQGVSKKSVKESEEYFRILDIIRSFEIPSNIFIVDAHDKISSHRIIATSDIVCVFWSTIALESLLLGIPTLTLCPEVNVWPIKELTQWQFMNNHDARKNFFDLPSNAGAPRTRDIVLWFERSFSGNWYQTCVPIITSSTLFKPQNFFWRAINKLNAKNFLYRAWIRSTDNSRIRNYEYRPSSNLNIFQRIILFTSILELRRWRDFWLSRMKYDELPNYEDFT